MDWKYILGLGTATLLLQFYLIKLAEMITKVIVRTYYLEKTLHLERIHVRFRSTPRKEKPNGRT